MGPVCEHVTSVGFLMSAPWATASPQEHANLFTNLISTSGVPMATTSLVYHKSRWSTKDLLMRSIGQAILNKTYLIPIKNQL